MNTAIYARFSSESQTTEGTIQTRLEAFRDRRNGKGEPQSPCSS